MIRRTNVFVNEMIARYYEADMALRKRIMNKVAAKCQDSKNDFLRNFGDGMLIGMDEGQRIARCTPDFYRKYANSFVPSVWAARDMVATFPWRGSKNYKDAADYLEAAVDYQTK